MKKQFYLLAAGLFTVCIANAQVQKGDVLLGGNLTFNTSKAPNSYTSKSNYIAVLPSIGKAVKDNLVVGLNLGYSHSHIEYGTSPVTNTNTDVYSLGAFVRRYKELGSKFYLFMEGDLAGNYQRSKIYADGTPSSSVPAQKTWGINAGLYPGIAYFLSRHVQLETGLQNFVYANYSHGSDRSRAFNVGTGFSQSLNNFVVGAKWVL